MQNVAEATLINMETMPLDAPIIIEQRLLGIADGWGKRKYDDLAEVPEQALPESKSSIQSRRDDVLTRRREAEDQRRWVSRRSAQLTVRRSRGASRPVGPMRARRIADVNSAR